MRLLAVILSLVPSVCLGQQTLTRAEVVDLMQDNAFCYEPDETGACSWAEVYNRFGGDTLYMLSAGVVDRGETSVLEERLVWIGDALCHLDNGEGIVTVYGTPDPALDFQMRNIRDLDPAARGAEIDSWTSARPDDLCFTYVADPQAPDHILQYTVTAGQAGKDTDRVLLIPRDRGWVDLIQ